MSGDQGNRNVSAIPKISAFLRRKSDSYFNRARSEDYVDLNDKSRPEFSAIAMHGPRAQTQSSQGHIEPVKEEVEPRGNKIRPNLSGQQLIKPDDDFL